MEIIKYEDSPMKQLPTGETRFYYMFEHAEVIVTHIPPGQMQPLHRHSEISELFYVVDGEIDAQEGNRRFALKKGDSLLIAPNSEFHTVSNPSASDALIVTFKFKPAIDSSPDVFKRDKQVIEEKRNEK